MSDIAWSTTLKGNWLIIVIQLEEAVAIVRHIVQQVT